jgi:uncharacterized protein YegL
MNGNDAVLKKGQTPTGKKLREVLEFYVPKIVGNPNHKPINIVVITDGEPTDDPKEVIVETAQYLDAMNVPQCQLGIQFVQIGDDEEATRALKELDDDLSPLYRTRV